MAAIFCKNPNNGTPDKEPNINDKPLFSEPTDEGIRKHHSTEHHKMRLFNHSISAQQNE